MPTSAWEFFQILTDLDKKIAKEMRRSSDSSLMEGKMALGIAIDLWDNFSKAGSWQPGQTLADAYDRFIAAMQKNVGQAPSGSTEERVYGDVLDLARLAKME